MNLKVFFYRAWLRIRVYCYKLIRKEPPAPVVESPKKIIEPPISLKPRRPVIPPVKPKPGQPTPTPMPVVREPVLETKTQAGVVPIEKKPLPVVQPSRLMLKPRKFRFSVTSDRKQNILKQLQDSSNLAKSGELFNFWRQQTGYPPLWIEALNLEGLMLSGIDWRNCFLHRVKFTHANLHKANFRAAVLRDVDFYQADLTDADFTGLDLSRVTGMQPDFAVIGAIRINPWFQPSFSSSIQAEYQTSQDMDFGMFSQSDLDRINAVQASHSDKHHLKKTKRAGELSPEVQEKAERAELLYKEGRLSSGEISQSLGISKTTFYRYLRLRNVKIDKSTRKKS